MIYVVFAVLGFNAMKAVEKKKKKEAPTVFREYLSVQLGWLLTSVDPKMPLSRLLSHTEHKDKPTFKMTTHSHLHKTAAQSSLTNTEYYGYITL